MSRQSTPLWFASCLSLGTKALGVVVLVGVILGSASAPAEAAWGWPYRQNPWVVRSTAPDQSWLLDVPEKSGAHARGKVAVFVFKGDDIYQPVRAEVVRLLRRKGLNVTATLRPVDTAAQYRELSYTLNVGAYVEGELSGEGARQSARISLRSGATGQRIATATFSGTTPKIVGAVNHGLWNRVGGTMMRACSSTSRPRRREREPLRIEAGTPLDNAPISAEGT